MRVQRSLVGLGTALVCTLAATAAMAQSCPGGGKDPSGGGVDPIEVPGEPCEPIAYATPFSQTFYSDGVAYIASGEIDNGDDFAAIGEVAEVELDVDDVMAALKVDEQKAIIMAAAAGIRPTSSKFDIVDASYYSNSPKLTNTEYKQLATYILASTQSAGRVTGRSDPATNNNTTRAQQWGQALGRALSQFNSRLPPIGFTYSSTRRRFSGGHVVEERTVNMYIGVGNPTNP